MKKESGYGTARFQQKKRAAAQKVNKRAGTARSRARRAQVRAQLSRMRERLAGFVAKLRRMPPRAAVAAGIALTLLVGIPIVIAVATKPVRAATGTQPPTPTPTLPLETSELVLQAAATLRMDEPVVETPPTPTPEPHPELAPLKEGINAPVVAEIQERLMELGYMDWDEPTDYYGPMTKSAVKLFQRKHGLTIDGYMGMETYTLLLSDQATKYSVSIGVEGTDVKELQIRLRELGYLDKATGLFGEETEAAVKLFQNKNGLSPDGTIGEKTREMLYSEDAKANYFGRGEVSDKLKTYQNKLKKLGYLTTESDGKYGNDTEAAVKRFQERSGLIADGYLGYETITLLMSGDAQANALMIGMNGSDVTNVQKRLKELGYLSGKADGYFGSGTENAVRAFQERNKLSVDGKVGRQTMSVLMSDSAKKASSSGSSSSSSSSSSGSSSSGSSGSSSSGSSSGSSGSSSSGSSSVSGGASVETFIAVAKSKMGSTYVRGGKGPNTFDCSGFVYWCLNQAGVKQSYMTSATWQKVTKYQKIKSMSSLKRGDVISFKGHVGIYLGDGQMIDASSSQGKVRIASQIQKSSYWTRHFVAGFRIF